MGPSFLAAGAAGAEWRKLGWLLGGAGYTTAAVRDLIGIPDAAEEILSHAGRYSLLYLADLAEVDDQVAALGCLFLLSGRVPLTALRIIEPELRDCLWRLGLIARDGDLARGTCGITELRGRYFLADYLFDNLGGDVRVCYRDDSCMPPHSSSLQLLGALRRPPGSSSFLDVGCGSGCQSIIAGADYDVLDGFDPSARSVAFARINALLNGSAARYAVDQWETFRPPRRYEHIAFNAPDAGTGFAFLNHGLGRLLAESGHAQVSVVCEVTRHDETLGGTLGRRIARHQDWRISIRQHPESPFTLPRERVAARALPPGSLLVSHPDEAPAFFSDLTNRNVDQIAHVTLTIQHA